MFHLKFDFNEYLQLRLPKGNNKEIPALHDIFIELKKYLLKNINNKLLVKAIKNNKDMVTCVCEILSKEAEYFRRNYNISELNHFQESYNVIELAKKYSDSRISFLGFLRICLT